MIEVREATIRSIRSVAANLREEDREEIEAATGRDPVAVLSQSFLISQESYTVFIRGVRGPCAAFGVLRASSGSPGVIWMLCTPSITRHVREVLKVADRWVSNLALRYDGLQALAWAGNYLHARWCEHLGFVELSRVSVRDHEFIHLYRPPTKED